MTALTEDLRRAVFRAGGIVRLDGDVIDEVAADPRALLPGVGIVAAAGLLGGLRAWPLGLVVGPLVALACSFALVGLWHIAATTFGVRGWDFLRIYRVVAHTFVLQGVQLLSVAPPLGQFFAILAGIYQLFLFVRLVEQVAAVEETQAWLVVFTPLVATCLLSLFAVLLTGAVAWKLYLRRMVGL